MLEQWQRGMAEDQRFLRITKDRNLCRAMIDHGLKGYDIYKEEEYFSGKLHSSFDEIN